MHISSSNFLTDDRITPEYSIFQVIVDYYGGYTTALNFVSQKTFETMIGNVIDIFRNNPTPCQSSCLFEKVKLRRVPVAFCFQKTDVHVFISYAILLPNVYEFCKVNNAKRNKYLLKRRRFDRVH